MITTLVMSVLLAVLYMGIAIWLLKDIPESISDIVWLHNGGKRWLWTIWIWLVTFTIAPSAIEVMPEEYKVVSFLMLACLLFVGVFPLFDTEHHRWHNVLGMAAGLLSQAVVAIVCPQLLLLWLWAAFLYIRGWYMKKALFVCEVICAVTLYTALLL